MRAGCQGGGSYTSKLQKKNPKNPGKAVRSNTGVKEKALKECCSLTITSCCQMTTVRVTGLFGVQGGVGVQGICRVA